MHVIEFPRPAKLMNLNDRGHWSKTFKLTREWREAAQYAALQSKVRGLGPSIVGVTLPVRGNLRRDPHNFIATVKPIIDGFVLARVWPDDHAGYVATLEPVLEIGGKVVRVEITPR